VSTSSQISKLLRHLVAFGIVIWFVSQNEVDASCGDYLHHPGTNAQAALDRARNEAILQQAAENHKREQTEEPTSSCQSGRCNRFPTSPLEPIRTILPRPNIQSEASQRMEIEPNGIVGHDTTDSTLPLQPFLEIALPPPRAS
jgi:hypothetical protein